MAIGGTFRASQPYAANVGGHGVNPIHGRIGDYTGGRRTTPGYGPNDGSLPMSVTSHEGAYGYVPEDAATMYGYGPENGTADRPRLQESTNGVRGRVPGEYPSPGYHTDGLPGGTKLRSFGHGSRIGAMTKLFFRRPVAQGLGFKSSGEVNDAGASNPDQLLIQTSMTQRDKTRAGSQAQAGRESQYLAPIRSRIPGMRVPFYAGGERHDDMRPRQQGQSRRPFTYRTGGTGNPDMMLANAAYTSVPLVREPAANPDFGQPVSELASPSLYDYGYVAEDVTW
jgi:hypothetical protein